jgi:hypothetical protein
MDDTITLLGGIVFSMSSKKLLLGYWATRPRPNVIGSIKKSINIFF